MKVLFMIIRIIHGLIHLLGFLKAFLIAELNEITNPVSKPLGLLWLLTSLIFVSAGIMLFLKNPIWWLFAVTGVLLSQILIFVFWKDTLYGSFPNVLILIVSLIGFAHFNFEKKINEEIAYIFDKVPVENPAPISAKDISTLPESVQKWLKVSGVLERAPIQSIYMKQNYLIKLKPEQKDWYQTSAEQYATVTPPSFVWRAEMEMMPAIGAFGRDKFIEGKGGMVFKLLSIIPVANDGPNPQINEAAMQRFLGEMVWYPSAALSEYVTWEETGPQTAKAIMNLDGLSGSGIFTFGEDGHVRSFSALRYRGSGSEAKRSEWVVNITVTKEFDGVMVPANGEVTWRLESEDWTWAKFEILECRFNPKLPDS